MRHAQALLVVLALAPAAAADSPAQAVLQALADARRLPAEIARRTLYLSLYHLDEAERQPLRHALAYWSNSLSREQDLIIPRQVSPDLVALVLDDYGWDPRVREKLAELDPYFHAVLEVEEEYQEKFWWKGGQDSSGKYYKAGWYTRKGKRRQIKAAQAPWLPTREIAELVSLTQSQAPLVRADWWLVLASRQLDLRNKQSGAGYYDWLRLRSRADYFKLIRFDAADPVREIRAALEKSGVSAQNRQIVRGLAKTGGAWVTLDADDESGRGNALLNLKKGDFVHQLEEWYAFAPNGLPLYLASSAAGVLAPTAPDTVGGDDSPLRVGRDPRIHVGIACLRCHGKDVLQPIDDWARKTYRGEVPLVVPQVGRTPAELEAQRQLYLDLRRQYLSDLGRELKRDRADFQERMRAASRISEEDKGLEVEALVQAVASGYNRYVEETVSPARAAREWGVSLEEMQRAFRAYAQAEQAAKGSTNPHLRNLSREKNPLGLSRVHFEELYPLGHLALKGVLP